MNSNKITKGTPTKIINPLSSPRGSPKNVSTETYIFTMTEIKRSIKKGRLLIILFESVYDFTSFAEHHPGGKKILHKYKGKDASDKFIEVGHFKMMNIVESLGKMRVGKFLNKPKL